jgi:hypothetical protein
MNHFKIHNNVLSQPFNQEFILIYELILYILMEIC